MCLYRRTTWCQQIIHWRLFNEVLNIRTTSTQTLAKSFPGNVKTLSAAEAISCF